MLGRKRVPRIKGIEIRTAEKMKNIICRIREGCSVNGGSLPIRLGFENLIFGYGKKDPLFNGADFDVRDKGIVLFKGDNGTGKTTILKLLVGFVSPQSGNVFCEADGAIGYSSANGSDVDPYVTCGDFMSDCLDGKNTLDLSEVLKSLDIFGKEQCRGLELSSGQIKKLSVFRAFVKSRCCVFLDEPLSFLSSRFKNEVIELIKCLKETMRILVIDHSEEFDRDADQVYEIRDKQIFRR